MVESNKRHAQDHSYRGQGTCSVLCSLSQRSLNVRLLPILGIRSGDSAVVNNNMEHVSHDRTIKAANAEFNRI